jgi:hypothetical protein
LNLLEYRTLKQNGLIRLDGAQAIIDRGEKTTIDKAQVEAQIKQRKEELEILEELLHDLG